MFELQRELFEQRRQNAIGDTVLLLEHDPTITMGRGARDAHLLASELELTKAGVALVRTDRGGDITLHAPGQLVAYPILTLPEGKRDVRKYVKALTEVMRQLVAHFGADAGTLDGYIGLWVDRASVQSWPGQAAARVPEKVGAIGVRLSRWTTMHGFALNLTTDLSLFRLIVPCGIREHGVASVASLTGQTPSTRFAAELAHERLCETLELPRGELVDASTRPLSWVRDVGVRQ